jgi:hypothetical protein
MDTLHDKQSDSFATLDRASLLENLFPGDPPVPRNGCRDLLVDTNSVGHGEVQTLFKPPALAVKNQDGNLFVFVWHDAGSYNYALECWDVDNAIGEVSLQRYKVLDLKFARETYFGLLALRGAVYAVSSETIDTNYDSDNCLAHKIIEWDATSKMWVAREMSIAQVPTISAPACSNYFEGLTVGKWVSYAGTYVRRTDLAAYDVDHPKTGDTFNPGELESIEDLDTRVETLLSGDVTKSFGDATTLINITIRTSNIVRYAWTGVGLDPDFGASGMEVGMWVQIESENFSGVNCGTFKVTSRTSSYFEIDNQYAVEQLSVLLGDSSAICTKFCKVTHTLPTVAELEVAQAQGATHYRLYRTDHADTKDIVRGLQHRFLVDIPIWGAHYAATWVDTISQAALEGETNYLSTTNYTDPPNGRFIAFSADRVFLGGYPTNRGRWWYTEVPGGDGGTSYAQQFPMKYASMFNVRDKWIDCDPDDGQVDTGIARMRDDLYFFKERKIFMLRNSDITQKVECISSEVGCVFPNTITVKSIQGFGEVCFFISQEGPAIIRSGGTVELLPEYAIEEMWPGGELLNRSTGELMNEYTRERVFAIVHDNTIFVLYGDSEDSDPNNLLQTNKNFGYHVSPDLLFKGCLKVSFADFTRTLTE